MNTDIWISYMDRMNGPVTINKDHDEVNIPLCDLMDIIQKYESVMEELYEYACDRRHADMVASQTVEDFDMIANVIRPE